MISLFETSLGDDFCGNNPVVKLVNEDVSFYQRTDGTIVDPIQDIFGGNHPYSGINLEAGVDLGDANLNNAYLR